MIQKCWTPEELVAELRKTTIGQDSYLQDLCIDIWMHNLRKQVYENSGEFLFTPKVNMLVLGKSGTGKTSTIQALAELLDLCVVVEDASSFTGTGWKGREVSSIVKDVLTLADTPLDAEFAIIVLDEIDKVFANNADNPSFPATNNFLKLIEGTDIRYEENNNSYRMNTENLLFICLGAFDGLDEIILKRLNKDKCSIGFVSESLTKNTDNIFASAIADDLIAYGVNPQFLGRIGLITSTNDLSEKDFSDILLHSESSVISQYDRLLSTGLGAHASITDTAAQYIAKQAAKDNKTGARALTQIVSDAIKPGLYDIAGMESIREIQMDYSNKKGIYLQYIHGKRDEIPVVETEQPKHSFSSDEYKKIPLQMSQYKLVDFLQYAENILENLELEEPDLTAKYSFRQLKAVVYMFAAVFMNMFLSESDQTMYSVFGMLQFLEAKIEHTDDEIFDIFETWHGEAAHLYSKSELFEPNIRKTISIAFIILESHCLRWLEKHKEADTED